MPAREAPTVRAVAIALAALTLVPLLPLGPVEEADAAANALLQVTFQQVATGLASPIGLTNAGDGTGRVFVIEQRGTVRVIDDGVLQGGFWLDVRAKVSCCGERGLLGLAFAPDYATTGRVYISYTRAGDGASVIERLVVPAPLTGPAPASGTILLVQAQPFANHNGGHIAFGPDGYLYFGLGDGGSAGDPQGNGQKLTTLLGKMLRLDVSGNGGYTIPPTNPFASGGGRAEIWAYGLRNPWRWSFDRATGDLWIADVGQNTWEEVNLQLASSAGGENYGWKQWEGYAPFTTTASPAGKTFPVLTYAHTPHCSVTGGYVNRGPSAGELAGAYLYGDYCSGVLWAAFGVGPLQVPVQLADTNWQITSFGEDEAGDVYLVHYGGSIQKIVG